jgi:hypothetical protein
MIVASFSQRNVVVQLPFAFVSASEGTNVVKVFSEAVRIGKVILRHGYSKFLVEFLADVPGKS